jgi:hypothetical protein
MKTKDFRISDSEFIELDKKFDKLCIFASWKLKRNNVHNNTGIDLDDYVQELRIALLDAGYYYKRQVYIESCFKVVNQYVEDFFTKQIIEELESLWKNRKKHGASRQKFGDYHEKILFKLVNGIVPVKRRPKKRKPLQIDKKFITYCKSICWNRQKLLGKKISKDRSFRVGQVSLSDLDGVFAERGNQ